MSARELLSILSDIPFWDVDKDNFDVETYPGCLIQKILEYGTLDDWRAIHDYFGIERIAEECMKLRTLSPKALSFICAMSDTKKENYRCYHFAQSNPTLWNS